MSQKNQSNLLKITCYGSSSSTTPQIYLNEAYNLGSTLAQRGHTCINGAGYEGCMGAMNKGVVDSNGIIYGVLHEMFLDINGKIINLEDFFPPSKDKENVSVVFAKGDDLQQRKRMLLENSNGIIVLPGGPGTWDELCEMICAKGLGLTNIPIVLINIDKYYDPFIQLMERCYNDTLMKVPPEDLVLVVSNSLDAIMYIENYNKNEKPLKLLGLIKDKEDEFEQKKKMLRQSSVIVPPSIGNSIWGRSISFLCTKFPSFRIEEDDEEYYSCEEEEKNSVYNVLTLPIMGLFLFGFSVGFTCAKMSSSSGRR